MAALEGNTKQAAPAAGGDAEEDDDVDLFGSDDEEDDAEAEKLKVRQISFYNF